MHNFLTTRLNILFPALLGEGRKVLQLMDIHFFSDCEAFTLMFSHPLIIGEDYFII